MRTLTILFFIATTAQVLLANGNQVNLNSEISQSFVTAGALFDASNNSTPATQSTPVDGVSWAKSNHNYPVVQVNGANFDAQETESGMIMWGNGINSRLEADTAGYSQTVAIANMNNWVIIADAGFSVTGGMNPGATAGCYYIVPTPNGNQKLHFFAELQAGANGDPNFWLYYFFQDGVQMGPPVNMAGPSVTFNLITPIGITIQVGDAMTTFASLGGKVDGLKLASANSFSTIEY